MMQLVAPIDIEDALRQDVVLLGVETFAPPAPDSLVPPCVCFESLGGTSQTPVSHEYDVSVDCWASTEAEAMALANTVCGLVCSLPIQELQSGRQYVTSDVNATPYLNPDPLRPIVPRATFRVTVSIRGKAIV